MKTIKLISLTFIVLLLFSNCKKETGPKGDTGPAGPAGPAGSSGIKNDQVFTFTTSTSSWNAINWPYNYLETTFSITAITNAVLTTGDVHVYTSDNGGTSWTALPYSFITSQYSYIIKSGQVLIDITMTNGNMPTAPGAQVYKIVVFPPAFVKQHPDINYSNYNEVENYIN